MLPQNVVIEFDNGTPFIAPEPTSRLMDYEFGGLTLDNPTGGMLYQLWTLEHSEGNFTLKDSQGNSFIIHTVSGEVAECSLAFTQEMKPMIVYVEDAVAKMYYFDDVSGTFKIREFSSMQRPHISLDDGRVFNINNSDIILTYVKNRVLCYRIQSEDFNTEYTITELIGQETIGQVGMDDGLRYKFKLALGDDGPDPIDPQPPTDICANAENTVSIDYDINFSGSPALQDILVRITDTGDILSWQGGQLASQGLEMSLTSVDGKYRVTLKNNDSSDKKVGILLSPANQQQLVDGVIVFNNTFTLDSSDMYWNGCLKAADTSKSISISQYSYYVDRAIVELDVLSSGITSTDNVTFSFETTPSYSVPDQIVNLSGNGHDILVFDLDQYIPDYVNIMYVTATCNSASANTTLVFSGSAEAVTTEFYVDSSNEEQLITINLRSKYPTSTAYTGPIGNNNPISCDTPSGSEYVGTATFSIPQSDVESFNSIELSLRALESVEVVLQGVTGGTSAITRITKFARNVRKFKFVSNYQLINVPENLPQFVRDLSGFGAGEGILNDPNISNWDVRRVKYLSNFLNNASSYSQDLSGWCVPLHTSQPANFAGSTLLTSEEYPIWGTCPNG